MKPSASGPRLVITPDIRDKILAKHGVSEALARTIFDLHWRSAIPHPVEPGDPPWNPPRFVLEERHEGQWYRLVFLLESPPGHEAILITCHPENHPKYLRKNPR